MSRTPVPANTRHWSRENLAWLAGLFEGEGTLVTRTFADTPGRAYITMRISMTDQDVIAHAYLIAGVGNLNGPYQYGHRKPAWMWTVVSEAHVYALLVALYPWLGQRRRARAEQLISSWRAQHEAGLRS